MGKIPTEIVCPICNTSLALAYYVGDTAHKCPTCSAPFYANKTIAKTGIVIWSYILASLTMISSFVLGTVTLFWHQTQEFQPGLFLAACSIILFSLVVGMILIALGKMVDNSNIQKYYTIARAKRNSVSSETETESGSQNNGGQP